MPNTCSITITRGKNKGKLCKNVNKTCRHQTIQCPNCGEDFSYKHTYSSHTRICMANRRTEQNDKRKITYIKKRNEHSEILERLHNLEQENKDLKNKVKKVSEQPRNINNIVVMGTDFFQELASKIGKDSAVKFLSTTATAGKPIDVIEKLYLEGKDPMNYPIACRNEDHFRYLSNDSNGHSKLVDDRGGAIIGDLMMDRLRNAFLMAANELISKQVDSGIEDDKEALRSVQNITTVNKEMIVYQLAAATNNANHPFFLDDGECEEATPGSQAQLC